MTCTMLATVILICFINDFPVSSIFLFQNIIISLAIGLVTILLVLYYVLRMKMKVTGKAECRQSLGRSQICLTADAGG